MFYSVEFVFVSITVVDKLRSVTVFVRLRSFTICVVWLWPVLFGVGVKVDHICGSKHIVDELAWLGFSISSYEVNRYKQSVSM